LRKHKSICASQTNVCVRLRYSWLLRHTQANMVPQLMVFTVLQGFIAREKLLT